jgi:RNA polymerase sigma-70 factor (ECF subfamily)
LVGVVDFQRRTPVNPTSVSLLERLRAARPDDPEWRRLEEIYQPLILRWIGRVPGLGDEAADITQEVFLVIVRGISRFEPQREGSFRAWVRGITVNVLRNHRRRKHRQPAVGLEPFDAFLNGLAEPNSELAREWDLDHDRHIFQKLRTIVQPEFSPATWEAFQRFAVDGLPASRVAAELGLSVNAVTLAKSRILRRLREEAGDLLR